MAALRRAALTAAAVCAALAAGARLVSAEPGQTLEPAGAPGGLRIVNGGPDALDVAREIVVERRGASGWMRVATEFDATSACADPAVRPVRIAAGAARQVVPWRGCSCSGRCDDVCRANICHGPGTFRFSVVVAPGGGLVVGPSFDMPARGG